MDGRGRIDVLVRPHGDGKIITITLSNISPAIVGEKDKERDVMAEGSPNSSPNFAHSLSYRVF
jgi:hypothetical protein